MFDLLGAGNIALVTDSMAAAGLADGQYRLGPAEVLVQDGVARLATTGSIAGGTAAMVDLVRNCRGRRGAAGGRRHLRRCRAGRSAGPRAGAGVTGSRGFR